MGGLPENPETKRRLKNLMEVTGLLGQLAVQSALAADQEELRRVHPSGFLSEFKQLSDANGGELGLRTPFSKGGFEIAALSAGLARGALFSVLDGTHKNAYSLSRPPGHHCLPDWPNGFCLLANIAIAVEAALAAKKCARVAVVDWDVHHGNGTEAIFYDRADVLTISMHQERNYPTNTGEAQKRGEGAGEGYNINIPIAPGAGHQTYLDAWDQIVAPALRRYQPDVIIIACGFDAALIDPLSAMLATVETFDCLTERAMAAADELCDGKLVMVHEGGYSEVYVPFCGHAVIARMAGSDITAPDPLAEMFAARQPGPAHQAFLDGQINELAAFHLR
jgi:acetoin utilization deacetylase AcuC-like enzyme